MTVKEKIESCGDIPDSLKDLVLVWFFLFVSETVPYF